MNKQQKAGFYVFLSYAREDAREADRLQERLEEEGVLVWRDTDDLWPGEDWRAKIRDAISGCSVFITCFSRRRLSRRSTYQNEELALAVEQLRLRLPGDQWLIPVRLDDCEIPDIDIGGGRTLASIERADLFGSRTEEGPERLVATVLQIRDRYHGSGQVSLRRPSAHGHEQVLAPSTGPGSQAAERPAAQDWPSDGGQRGAARSIRRERSARAVAQPGRIQRLWMLAQAIRRSGARVIPLAALCAAMVICMLALAETFSNRPITIGFLGLTLIAFKRYVLDNPATWRRLRA